MLKRILALAFTASVVVLGLVGPSGVALADEADGCTTGSGSDSGVSINDPTVSLGIVVETGGECASTGDPGAAGGSAEQPQDIRDDPRCLLIESDTALGEVPCTLDEWGWWNNWNQCYVAERDPDAVMHRGDATFHGRGGTTYREFLELTGQEPPASARFFECAEVEFDRASCASGLCSYSPAWITTNPDAWVTTTVFWWEGTPPGYRGPTVDPYAEAMRLIASFDLRGIEVGMAPDAGDPDAKAYVGLPVWMWVADADDPLAFGPYTRSVSAGGIDVSATARVTSIDWDMGDGTVVTCAGPGTPFDPAFGVTESPDCGHVYERTSRTATGGEYEITATSHWSIDWTAGPASGTETLDTSTPATLRVSELQSVNVTTQAG